MKGSLTIALALAFASWPAPSQTAPSHPIPSELATAAQASAQPPLRSAAALEAYLQANARKHTPLDALSPLARQRFRESLVFGPEGADPYDYDRGDLIAELTASQIRALLGLFGIEPDAYLLQLARPASKPATRQQAETQPSVIAQAYDRYITAKPNKLQIATSRTVGQSASTRLCWSRPSTGTSAKTSRHEGCPMATWNCCTAPQPIPPSTATMPASRACRRICWRHCMSVA